MISHALGFAVRHLPQPAQKKIYTAAHYSVAVFFVAFVSIEGFIHERNHFLPGGNIHGFQRRKRRIIELDEILAPDNVYHFEIVFFAGGAHAVFAVVRDDEHIAAAKFHRFGIHLLHRASALHENHFHKLVAVPQNRFVPVARVL